MDRAALDVTPPKPRWVGMLKWIIPTIILLAFVVLLAGAGYVAYDAELATGGVADELQMSAEMARVEALQEKEAASYLQGEVDSLLAQNRHLRRLPH